MTDTDTQFIWLNGNLSEGFAAFGPYESMDEACAMHDGDEGWAMTLHSNVAVYADGRWIGQVRCVPYGWTDVPHGLVIGPDDIYPTATEARQAVIDAHERLHHG